MTDAPSIKGLPTTRTESFPLEPSSALRRTSSKTTSSPVLDKLKFVSGLALNTNVVIGEKVVGKESRAVGQVVSAPNATEITFVYLKRII